MGQHMIQTYNSNQNNTDSSCFKVSSFFFGFDFCDECLLAEDKGPGFDLFGDFSIRSLMIYRMKEKTQ